MAIRMREGILDERNVPAERRDLAAEFDALVCAESARIRRLAWRFGVPAQELDDAVQDVFVRAWAGFARYRGEATARTWLTRIAVNHLTSWRRGMMRRLRRWPEFVRHERRERVYRDD